MIARNSWYTSTRHYYRDEYGKLHWYKRNLTGDKLAHALTRMKVRMGNPSKLEWIYHPNKEAKHED